MDVNSHKATVQDSQLEHQIPVKGFKCVCERERENHPSANGTWIRRGCAALRATKPKLSAFCFFGSRALFYD